MLARECYCTDRNQNFSALSIGWPMRFVLTRFVLLSMICTVVHAVLGCNAYPNRPGLQATYPAGNRTAYPVAPQPGFQSTAPSPTTAPVPPGFPNGAVGVQPFPTSPSGLSSGVPVPASPALPTTGNSAWSPAVAPVVPSAGSSTRVPNGGAAGTSVQKPAWGGGGFRDTRWPF